MSTPLRHWTGRASAPLAQAVIAAVGALIFSLWFLWSTPLQERRTFALGSIDRLTARGFHAAETSAEGRSLRWTDGDSEIALPALGLGAHTLRLTISAPRPDPAEVPVTISVNGQRLAEVAQSAQVRRYALLVPGRALGLSDNIAFLNDLEMHYQGSHTV